MTAFESFVRAETEQEAQQAEKAFRDEHAAFVARSIHMTAFPARIRLAVGNPALAAQVLRTLAVCRLRRRMCLKSLELVGDVEIPEMSDSPIAAIRDLAANTLAHARKLAAAADPDGRKRLESERDDLQDRVVLAGLLPNIEAEVKRLSALDLIKVCLAETATNAITALGNKIADLVITPKVRDRFQEEIQQLAAGRVRVDIVRSGGHYGSPHYEVRLFTNARAKVASVLSEGEQTCVALASFLTELATAAHRSPLVFDDPVSSLDHRWRHKVAERLIKEASTRQIIVFTHDLIFLNDLQSLAKARRLPADMVTLTQSAVGAGVVNQGLPWIGASVRDRLDKLAHLIHRIAGNRW